jgi:C-terminal processing protease CtpA/Prc
MVAGLEDPYSRYLDPAAYQESQREPGEQTVGIAVTIQAKTEVPVTSERILDHDGVRIGYLRFTGFSESSAEELRAANPDRPSRRGRGAHP